QVLPNDEVIMNTPVADRHIELDDPGVWDKINDAMDEVTTDLEGTGLRFGSNSPYPVAAKTGTAQVVSTQQRDKKEQEELPEMLRDHSLFIAFAPVQAPEIVIAVVVENDKKAPQVARKVMDLYMERHLSGVITSEVTDS
ncbi:MAG: penicillin-binding transpeptidase domain-containing protein, partial [Gammaproteobacteria bacterium]